MKSMTAFGRSTGQANGKSYCCEIKSVNNRYADINVKLPRQYSFLEEKVVTYIKERVSRGKIDVYIGIENLSAAGVTVSVDEEYARSYIAALRGLADKYGLKVGKKLPLTLVASNSNVFVNSRKEEDDADEWELLKPFLNDAFIAFDGARQCEGQRLCEDLLEKKEHLIGITEKIKSRSEANASGYREKLEERLRKTLGNLDMTFDSDRILTEVAIYSDKIAVDEELVRLGSHFKAFDDIIRSDEPAGRKLDFLVQEMNREINTTGSKCCDAEIASLVVDAKCELEKIREQIQNLE